MEEELIEAVRSEKCLYDVKHQDYVKIKLKNSIWKRIAKGLNFKDGNEAKKSWEKLRNNHRDALRRQKTVKPKSGSGAVKIKPWRFQENMAFLIPHMGNRTNKTHKRRDIQNDESSGPHSDTKEQDIQENLRDNEEFKAEYEETNQSSEPSSTLTDLLNRSIEAHEQRIENRQRERDTNDFIVRNVKNDPLFHFFMSMYQTTKTLPPLSQHTIKTSIFSLVATEESKNFIEKSRCSTSTKACKVK